MSDREKSALQSNEEVVKDYDLTEDFSTEELQKWAVDSVKERQEYERLTGRRQVPDTELAGFKELADSGLGYLFNIPQGVALPLLNEDVTEGLAKGLGIDALRYPQSYTAQTITQGLTGAAETVTGAIAGVGQAVGDYLGADVDYAENFARNTQPYQRALERSLSEKDEGGLSIAGFDVSQTARRIGTGTVSSLLPMLGTGGVAGVATRSVKLPAFLQRIQAAGSISSVFGAKAYQQEYADQIQAGASRGEATKRAALSFGIEFGITTGFSAFGAGGAETAISRLVSRTANPNKTRQAIREAAARAAQNRLKRFGKDVSAGLAAEIAEETTIEFLNALSRKASGVDPNALSPEQLSESMVMVVGQTVATMGLIGAARTPQRGLERKIEQAAAQRITQIKIDEENEVVARIHTEGGQDGISADELARAMPEDYTAQEIREIIGNINRRDQGAEGGSYVGERGIVNTEGGVYKVEPDEGKRAWLRERQVLDVDNLSRDEVSTTFGQVKSRERLVEEFTRRQSDRSTMLRQPAGAAPLYAYSLDGSEIFQVNGVDFAKGEVEVRGSQQQIKRPGESRAQRVPIDLLNYNFSETRSTTGETIKRSLDVLRQGGLNTGDMVQFEAAGVEGRQEGVVSKILSNGRVHVRTKDNRRYKVFASEASVTRKATKARQVDTEFSVRGEGSMTAAEIANELLNVGRLTGQEQALAEKVVTSQTVSGEDLDALLEIAGRVGVGVDGTSTIEADLIAKLKSQFTDSFGGQLVDPDPDGFVEAIDSNGERINIISYFEDTSELLVRDDDNDTYPIPVQGVKLAQSSTQDVVQDDAEGKAEDAVDEVTEEVADEDAEQESQEEPQGDAESEALKAVREKYVVEDEDNEGFLRPRNTDDYVYVENSAGEEAYVYSYNPVSGLAELEYEESRQQETLDDSFELIDKKFPGKYESFVDENAKSESQDDEVKPPTEPQDEEVQPPEDNQINKDFSDFAEGITAGGNAKVKEYAERLLKGASESDVLEGVPKGMANSIRAMVQDARNRGLVSFYPLDPRKMELPPVPEVLEPYKSASQKLRDIKAQELADADADAESDAQAAMDEELADIFGGEPESGNVEPDVDADAQAAMDEELADIFGDPPEIIEEEPQPRRGAARKRRPKQETQETQEDVQTPPEQETEGDVQTPRQRKREERQGKIREISGKRAEILRQLADSMNQAKNPRAPSIVPISPETARLAAKYVGYTVQELNYRFAEVLAEIRDTPEFANDFESLIPIIKRGWTKAQEYPSFPQELVESADDLEETANQFIEEAKQDGQRNQRDAEEGGDTGQRPDGEQDASVLEDEQTEDEQQAEEGEDTETDSDTDSDGSEESGAGSSGQRDVEVGGDVDGGGRTDDDVTGERRPDGRDADGEESAQEAVRENYELIDDDRIMPRGMKRRFNNNLRAIELSRLLELENRNPTKEEKDILASYTGFGAFGQALFQGTYRYPRPQRNFREESDKLRNLVSEEEWKSMQRSTPNAHFTGPKEVRFLYDVLKKLGVKGGRSLRILEPAIGSGNFFSMMPRDVMESSALTGVDLDIMSSKIAQQLHPDATIEQMDYRDLSPPDNFYDLIVGNVPFGDIPTFDRRYKSERNEGYNVHNYFFRKSFDKLKPGGVMAFITSTGTMDGVGEAALMRDLISKGGDLVAAYRFPKNALNEFAGTAVVADLVVIRKRKEGESGNGVSWLETKDIETPNGEVNVNEYWEANPNNIFGELTVGPGLYATDATTVNPVEGVYDESNETVEDAISRLPSGLFDTKEDARDYTVVVEPTNRRVGSVSRQKGKLTVWTGSGYVPFLDKYTWGSSLSQKTIDRRTEELGLLVDVKEALGNLLDAQARGEDATAERKALNDAYDAYKAKYRYPIAKSPIINIFDAVGDKMGASVGSIEVTRNNKTEKSVIFSRPTVRTRKAPDNPTALDAYAMHLNETLSFDIDRIAEIANTDKDKAISELLDAGLIAKTAGGNYAPADQYFSGNTLRKLRELKSAQAQGVTGLRKSIARMEAVAPKQVDYTNIGVAFGATWIESGDYERFIYDNLGFADTQRARQGLSIKYVNGAWIAEAPDWNINHDYGDAISVEGYPAKKIIELAMNPKTLPIPKRDGKPDMKRAQEIADKVKGLKDAFADWVWSEPDRIDRLAAAYNETVNVNTPRSYDNVPLTFEGMALSLSDNPNDPFSMRPHQARAAWKGVSSGGGLFAHEVGTGKTFTIGAIAMESKRLGLARKSVLFALNANAAEVASDIQMQYPGAKVTFIDETNDMNKQSMSIMKDDWDLVVLPHTWVDKISFKSETIDGFTKKELASFDADLIEQLKADNQRVPDNLNELNVGKGSRLSQTAKALAKARLDIVNDLQKMAGATEGDSFFFEDFGFDQMFIDEAHAFKKIDIRTSQKIRGLNTSGGKRTRAVQLMSEFIRTNNNGKGVYLFTGTPITNTLNEIFNMFRIAVPEVMEQSGVKQWDGFFANFAEASNNVEISPGGEWQVMQRLTAFKNLPELRTLMEPYMDVVFADDAEGIGVREEFDGKQKENAQGRPYKKTVNEIMSMTQGQAEKSQELLSRYREFKSLGGQDKFKAMKGQPRELMPLLIDQEGAAMATDPRMAGVEVDRLDPNLKVNRMVSRAMDHYHEEELTTQFIFMEKGYTDTGTITTYDDDGNRVVETIPRFNLANEIKRRLMEEGVPESEIAIFGGKKSTSAKAKKEKREMVRKMNDGTIRFAIGSTQTLGTGVNAQKHARAIHHIDCPWMPGEKEQRDGRAHRQGNLWNTVFEYRYLTESPQDARRWNILLTKARFIKAFLQGNMDERVIEIESDMLDDKSDSNADPNVDLEQTMSAAAGDPRRAQIIKLRVESKELLESKERQKENVDRELRRAENAIPELQESKKKLKKLLKAQEIYRKNKKERDEKRKAEKKNLFVITLGGREIEDVAEADTVLSRMIGQRNDTGGKELRGRPIGEYMGFKIFSDGTGLSLTYNGELLTTILGGTVASVNARLAQPRAVEQLQGVVEAGQARAKRARSLAEKPFSQESRLVKKRGMLAKLMYDLDKDPSNAPAWLRYAVPPNTSVFHNGEERVVIGYDGSKSVLVEYKKGEDQQDPVISYRDVQDAISGANLRLETVKKEEGKPDGYVILDQNGERYLKTPEGESPVAVYENVLAMMDGSSNVPMGWKMLETRNTSKAIPVSELTDARGVAIFSDIASMEQSEKADSESSEGSDYFSAEAFDKANKEAGGRSTSAVITMSTDDFIDSTLTGEDVDERDREDALGLIGEGVSFRSIPVIEFEHDNKGKARVVRHSGLAEVSALQESGVEEIPVLLRSVGDNAIYWVNQSDRNSPDRIENWPEDLVSQDGKDTLDFQKIYEDPLFFEDTFEDVDDTLEEDDLGETGTVGMDSGSGSRKRVGDKKDTPAKVRRTKKRRVPKRPKAPLDGPKNIRSGRTLSIGYDNATPNAPVASDTDDAPGVSASDIQKTLLSIFDMARSTFVRRLRGKTRLGQYEGLGKSGTAPRVLTLDEQAAESIAVTMHEVGHHLDREYGITVDRDARGVLGKGSQSAAAPAEVLQELEDLDYDDKKNRSYEGWAEFVRLYMTEPTVFGKDGKIESGVGAKAPVTYKWLKEYVKSNKELGSKLDRANEYIKQFRNQSVIQRMRAIFADREAQNLDRNWKDTLKDRLRSVRNAAKKATDSFYFAEAIDSSFVEAGGVGANLKDYIYANYLVAPRNAARALEEGVFIPHTGNKIKEDSKGFIEMVQDALENDIDYVDVQMFLWARHTVWASANKPKYNTGLNPDEAKRILHEIKKQDPKRYQRFEKLGENLSEFAHDLLRMRVQSGSLDEAVAKKAIDQYKGYYLPMQRASGDPSKSAGYGSSYLSVPNSIRGRSKEGSGRPPRDFFAQISEMAHEYYDIASRARVNQKLATMILPEFGGVEGLGWVGRKVDPKLAATKIRLSDVKDQLLKGGVIDEDDIKAEEIASRLRDGDLTTKEEREFLLGYSPDGQGVDPSDESAMLAIAEAIADYNDEIISFRPSYRDDQQNRIAVTYIGGEKVLVQYDQEVYAMLHSQSADTIVPTMGILKQAVTLGNKAFKSATVGANLKFGISNALLAYMTYQFRANKVKGLKTFTDPLKQTGYIAYAARKGGLVGKTFPEKDKSEIRSEFILFDTMGGDVQSKIGRGRSLRAREANVRDAIAAKWSKFGFTVDPVSASKTVTRSAKGLAGRASQKLSYIESVVAAMEAPVRIAEMVASIEEDGWVPMTGGYWKRVGDNSGKSKRKGLPEEVQVKAMTAAAEADVNFKKGARWSKKYDLYLPFLNASVAGITRFGEEVSNLSAETISGRLFDPDAQDLDTRKARRYAVGLTTLATFSALYALLRADDEDWLDQQDYNLDKYWMFGNGERTLVRIPKPREEQLVCNLAEILVMSLVNEEAENRDSFEDALGTVRGQFFSMVPLGGGFFKAAIENYGNKDTFRDQAIEPVYMNNRSRYMRYDDDTTAIAKATSRLMNEYLAWTGLPMYSPLKTDHILDQTTGGLYRRTHRAFDSFGQADLEGLYGVVSQVSGGNAFYVPDRMTSRSVNDFYQEMARLRTRKDDLSVERLDKDAAELSDVNTRLKELNDYRALISVIRNLNESDQEKYKPYIAGLAREAMGFREHHRSKSPTREPAGVLPKEVEVAVQDFYKDRTYSAVRLSQIPQTVPERQLEGGITLADLRRARYDDIEARLDFIDQNLESSPLLVDFLAKEFRSRSNRDSLRRRMTRGAKGFEMSGAEFSELNGRHRELKDRIMDLKRRVLQ